MLRLPSAAKTASAPHQETGPAARHALSVRLSVSSRVPVGCFVPVLHEWHELSGQGKSGVPVVFVTPWVLPRVP